MSLDDAPHTNIEFAKDASEETDDYEDESKVWREQHVHAYSYEEMTEFYPLLSYLEIHVFLREEILCPFCNGILKYTNKSSYTEQKCEACHYTNRLSLCDYV